MAQEAAAPPLESRNGWVLPPYGTIRILVLFAEIEYDVNPASDPQPNGADHWPKGQLPRWRNELFDPQPLPVPSGMVSKYYHDISFGRYTVLGDHMDRLLVIKESQFPQLRTGYTLSGYAVQVANATGAFTTAHGSRPADLDLWRDGSRPGAVKLPGPDEPSSLDHVMLIVRNSTALTHGQGSTDGGSSGPLFGHESDTQSRFGAMNGLPFEILKHEFNHLLLGGNNFHSGGGNAAPFESHTLCVQGGWSMMGAANSSLLTCSGWDRQRLGWAPPDSAFPLQAMGPNGKVVNGDLEPLSGDTGTFVLRDFVTTGDVLRIRMPFIPRNEYQQWLWIENHGGFPYNGSATDRFHWESTGNPCIETIRPGIFMQMQIDRENRLGTGIFGGAADYLRPVLANGFHHLALTTDTIRETCPFHGQSPRAKRVRPEPLSGNHEQELVVYDRNKDGKAERGEHFSTAVLQGEHPKTSPRFFGRSEHAFTPEGNRRLGMDSNPSSANQLTLLCSGGRERNKGAAPDNRTVYLNGIEVTLLERLADQSIRVRIVTGRTRIQQDVIWTADSIVLPPLRGEGGHALTLAAKRTLVLDRSLTPTRIAAQGSDRKHTWFAPPTRFTVQPDARMVLEDGATLRLRRGTAVHLLPGAELRVQGKARIVAEKDSRVTLHPGAALNAPIKVLNKLRKRGVLIDLDP